MLKSLFFNEKYGGLTRCDIQHQIDLIPGFSLPNQAATRMSPSEHEELSRRVSERIKKGLVRERVPNLVLCHPSLRSRSKHDSRSRKILYIVYVDRGTG
jgi:hypothetical protein